MKSEYSAPVIWFCGLPGSGKTTIAKGVYERLVLDNPGTTISLVSMDSIRKKIFPNPTYSDEERDAAYRCLVLVAGLLSKSGVVVIVDATAHKLIWRNLARTEFKSSFIEVYVSCPVNVCIERETMRTDNSDNIRKRLYLDALERLKSGKKTDHLGKVPGVDEPFEESSVPDIVLDSEKSSPKELVESALQGLKKLLPENFSTN